MFHSLSFVHSASCSSHFHTSHIYLCLVYFRCVSISLAPLRRLSLVSFLLRSVTRNQRENKKLLRIINYTIDNISSFSLLLSLYVFRLFGLSVITAIVVRWKWWWVRRREKRVYNLLRNESEIIKFEWDHSLSRPHCPIRSIPVSSSSLACHFAHSFQLFFFHTFVADFFLRVSLPIPVPRSLPPSLVFASNLIAWLFRFFNGFLVLNVCEWIYNQILSRFQPFCLFVSFRFSIFSLISLAASFDCSVSVSFGSLSFSQESQLENYCRSFVSRTLTHLQQFRCRWPFPFSLYFLTFSPSCGGFVFFTRNLSRRLKWINEKPKK